MAVLDFGELTVLVVILEHGGDRDCGAARDESPRDGGEVTLGQFTRNSSTPDQRGSRRWTTFVAAVGAGVMAAHSAA